LARSFILQSLIKTIRKNLKRNQFVFFTYRKFTDKDYISNKKELKIGKNSKSIEKIKHEMSLIRRFWKCDPMHYIRYKLYLEENNLSEEDLLNYIPPYYFYNYYCPKLFQDQNLDVIDDKILLDRLFHELKIPTAKTICIIKDGEIFDHDGNMINEEIFENIIKNLTCRRMFIKPSLGKSGVGIFVAEKAENSYLIDNTALSYQFLKKLAQKKNWILQEGILQREDFSQINSSSVNTLRILTNIKKEGNPIKVAILRMGRLGSYFDNSHLGGLSNQINIETGEFSPYAYSEHDMIKTEYHPDSGFRFKNNRIKNWDSIVKEIKLTAYKLKDYVEIAWDVAVTEQGVLFIEANSFYGIDHMQCSAGGMRKVLGIDFPQ